MKKTVEQIFDDRQPMARLGVDSYNASKFNVGTLMCANSGPGAGMGPYLNLVCRIKEITGFTYSVPHVIKYTNNKSWIFLFEYSTVTASRRVALVEHNKLTNQLNYKGYIVWQGLNIAGNKNIRSGRGFLYQYNTGTVSVSGRTVTGTGTLFLDQRIPQGTRIGFGSNDNDAITTWYEIATVTNNTTLILQGSPGTLTDVPYVIEDLRIALAITNTTAGNGGLFLIKGINEGTFTLQGTTILENSTNDVTTGVYWLKDAATVTNAAAAGIAHEDVAQATSGTHFIYVVDAPGAGLAAIFKYNLRFLLSGPNMSSGTVSGSTIGFPLVFKTGPSSLGGSAMLQINNADIIPIRHGVASGSNCIFFIAISNIRGRVFRTVDVKMLNSGSIAWIGDFMSELPIGGGGAMAPSGAFVQVKYLPSIDKLLIGTAGVSRIHISDYKTNYTPFDSVSNVATLQLYTSYADLDTPPMATARNQAFFSDASVNANDGWVYLVSAPVVAGNPDDGANCLYAVPMGADTRFADKSNQYIITPKISTLNAAKLYRLGISAKSSYGSKYLFPPEPIKIWVRTQGIDDNTGAWAPIDDKGDLSGLNPGDYIQVRIGFCTMGLTGLPGLVYNLSIIYEDNTQDSHYLPSIEHSSANDRIFAWKQIVPWGSGIPNLKIRILKSGSNAPILIDSTSKSEFGTWQYSANGTSWNTWSNSADNVGNYIRYAANSLPNYVGVQVELVRA
jgi:hypothetical protein